MIKVKAIKTEKGYFKPESIPEKRNGSHFDGEFFCFFESKEEAKQFYDSQPVLPQVPVKSEFMEALEKATDEELEFLAEKLANKTKNKL